MQPIEGIRLLWRSSWPAISRANGNCCGKCTTPFAAVRRPRWLDLPRMDHVLPVLGGVAMALALFFLQRISGRR